MGSAYCLEEFCRGVGGSRSTFPLKNRLSLARVYTFMVGARSWIVAAAVAVEVDDTMPHEGKYRRCF